MSQKIINCDNDYKLLDEYLKSYHKLFIVCDKSFDKLKISEYFNSLKRENIELFSDFAPNPSYDAVLLGVKSFLASKADIIIAVGGGSAMDVAKCIRAFSTMDHEINYLEQPIVKNNIPFLAVPTTAGTGSEATRYAVIYYNGVKQTVTDDSLIPEIVVFDPTVLNTLPIYQKKATLLDTFSHAIESYWSINANAESRKYALEALDLVIQNMNKYLAGDNTLNSTMLKAANLAGKAINISQTTAGHSLCYKLTTLYNVSHGHATMLVNSELYPYMIDHLADEELRHVFLELAKHLGFDDLLSSRDYFRNLLVDLDLYDVNVDYKDIPLLVSSVNLTRLKNNPYKLSEKDIENIYLNIFDAIEKRK